MPENMHEGVEIPAELLERISGGELSGTDRFTIVAWVWSYKREGKTLEQAIQDLDAEVKNWNGNYDEFVRLATETYNNLT